MVNEITPKNDLITELMIAYARQEKLTKEELEILEAWWDKSPQNRQLMRQFGDPDWVSAALAKMKPAPMKEMWAGVNAYLDMVGAPDDREFKEWRGTEKQSWWRRLCGWVVRGRRRLQAFV